MSSGYFKIKQKSKLSEMQLGDKLPESDFSTLTPDGYFVQMEYVEEDETAEPYKIKPGIFTIKKSMSGMYLEKTSFVEDAILESYVHTENITSKIDCFFKNIHVYKELGFDVPTRKALLFGPAGTGKSTSITKVSRNYSSDPKMIIVVWPTDKYESHEVKDFVKKFDYSDVERMIFIVEDLGGIEIDQQRQRSDSSLLSLLDNQEKTFKIPTFLLATTNFPENFLGNLTNRPGRFDDKIEVGYPAASFRAEFLKFFNKSPTLSSEVEQLISHEKCKEFTPAHIKEIVIRSRIYDKDMLSVINDMLNEIQQYKKAFTKTQNVGF